MPISSANLQKMLNAVQSVSDALPQAQHVETQTDEALSKVHGAWRSPTAAPKFYQHLQTWQDDHRTLNSALDNLVKALTDVHADLLKKEQALTR